MQLFIKLFSNSELFASKYILFTDIVSLKKTKKEENEAVKKLMHSLRSNVYVVLMLSALFYLFLISE